MQNILFKFCSYFREKSYFFIADGFPSETILYSLFSVTDVICISVVNGRELAGMIQLVFIEFCCTNHAPSIGKMLSLSISNYSRELTILEIFSSFTELNNLVKLGKHLTNL